MRSERRRSWAPTTRAAGGRACLAAAVVALCGLLAPAPAAAGVIERVLAAVDDTPVLQSEVELLRRIRGLEPAAALQAMIDETLMQREADRLPEAAVQPEEEARALLSLERTLGSEAAELRGPALRALARRQTAILKYVELRFRSRLRVDEEDVFRAYEAEQAGRASAQSFEAQAPEIRARLERRALDERIESWIGELRAAARIRINPVPPPLLP